MIPGPSGFTPEERAHLDALADMARRFRALHASPHIGVFSVAYNPSDPRSLLEQHDKAAVDAITKGMDDRAGVSARLTVHYADMVSKGWTEVGPEPTLARTHVIWRDFRVLAGIAARMAALVPLTASDEEAERAWLMELRTRGYYSEWQSLVAPAEASAQLCGALSAEVLARSMTPREAPELSSNSEARHTQPFPGRASWFRHELDERHWDVHILEKNDGPSYKSSRKILRGERVAEVVLDRVCRGLSRKLRQVVRKDIPND